MFISTTLKSECYWFFEKSKKGKNLCQDCFKYFRLPYYKMNILILR